MFIFIVSIIFINCKSPRKAWLDVRPFFFTKRQAGGHPMLFAALVGHESCDANTIHLTERCNFGSMTVGSGKLAIYKGYRSGIYCQLGEYIYIYHITY